VKENSRTDWLLAQPQNPNVRRTGDFGNGRPFAPSLGTIPEKV
jgi:hypothetical protein